MRHGYPVSSGADIIVVGCGVAGATAAETAASLGSRVLILEEHDRVGIPSHCSGHVGIKSMRRLGIQLPGKIIKNQIRGATFHSPSGQTLRLERRTPITWVVDRRAFDEHPANRASKAVAEMLLNCRALSMRTTEPTTVEVRVSSKEKPGTINQQGSVADASIKGLRVCLGAHSRERKFPLTSRCLLLRDSVHAPRWQCNRPRESRLPT